MKNPFKPKAIEIPLLEKAESEERTALRALALANKNLGKARLAVQANKSEETHRELLDARLAHQMAEADVNESKQATIEAKAEYAKELAEKERREEAAAWKKIESRIIPDLIEAAKKLEADLVKACDELMPLINLANQALDEVPATDGTSRGDCLMSELRIQSYFKLQMRRCGLHWAEFWPDDPRKILTFSQSIEEACRWMVKLSPNNKLGKSI